MQAILRYIAALNPGKNPVARILWLEGIRQGVDAMIREAKQHEDLKELEAIAKGDDREKQNEMATDAMRRFPNLLSGRWYGSYE